jgi:hypothetical protein
VVVALHPRRRLVVTLDRASTSLRPWSEAR